MTDEEVVAAFHKLYYKRSGETWDGTYWLGSKILKCPLDTWMYQEIVHELRPDVIVECGTRHGGSALFLACLLDLLGRGRVITIDIEPICEPAHRRIEFMTANSASPDTFARVQGRVRPDERVMVILDSDHHKDHVLREMVGFSPLVSVGQYMIVEDGNINGNPVYPDFGPGPAEAIQEFLKSNDHFKIDKYRERLMLTMNPNGYLKKISS